MNIVVAVLLVLILLSVYYEMYIMSSILSTIALVYYLSLGKKTYSLEQIKLTAEKIVRNS